MKAFVSSSANGSLALFSAAEIVMLPINPGASNEESELKQLQENVVTKSGLYHLSKVRVSTDELSQDNK